MDKTELPPSLLLRVNNSDRLQSGYDASWRFTPQGGRVGSDDTCFWRVQDNAQHVASVHFAVTWQDATFCLHALSYPLMLNRVPVKQDSGLIRLRHGDEIGLGTLSIQVLISFDGAGLHDPLQITPQSLVTPPSDLLEPMLESHGSTRYAPASDSAPLMYSRSLDPLQALQNEALSLPTDLATLTVQRDQDVLPQQPDELEMTSGELVMEQEYMTLPQINQHQPHPDSSTPLDDLSGNYVAVTPLIRGLDAPLAIADSQQMHDFLEEVGRTLQAAIKGLISLQRQQDTLSDKHLRPLEDNPLRLSLDYLTTLNVLFAEGKARYTFQLRRRWLKACVTCNCTIRPTRPPLPKRCRQSCWRSRRTDC